MALTAKDMMAATIAAVPKITVAEAQALLRLGAVPIDDRDAPEVENTGMAS